jgi:RNA polymerase sigma factor (sigma-70 family)
MHSIRSDEHLINEFLRGPEEDSQSAFESLVKRHGPMVLGVCRYVLGQSQDAEDAFQATFLTLARKAQTIRNRFILAAWLHEVAYRTALHARDRTIRRRGVERQAIAFCGAGHSSGELDEPSPLKELWPVLYEEMNRLPVKYGIPVALCYMEGKTNQEVADLLNWPIGTVKGRMSRARDMLRARLLGRGLDAEKIYCR